MNEVRDSYRAVGSNRQTETHAFHYFFVFVVNIVIIRNRLNAYDREINLGPRTLPLNRPRGHEDEPLKPWREDKNRLKKIVIGHGDVFSHLIFSC